MRIKLVYLIISLLYISFPIDAQDMMYKSNGGKIEVQVVDKNRQYLSYRLAGAKDSTLHYISTTVLDSVVSGNGKKELYALQRKTELLPETITKPDYGRHLIGADAASLAFYKSLAVSYEYFIWNQSLGVKAMFGFNLSEDGYYDNKWYSTAYQKGQFARIGLNYYFFPPGSFRVGTGLHFIASKYKVHGEQYINNPDPPYETIIQKVEEERKFRNIVMTVFVFYHITKNLAINAGLDFPNKSPYESESVFRSEILLNF
jgi:hypothetical protein